MRTTDNMEQHAEADAMEQHQRRVQKFMRAMAMVSVMVESDNTVGCTEI
jgi:hypothetical protein